MPAAPSAASVAAARRPRRSAPVLILGRVAIQRSTAARPTRSVAPTTDFSHCIGGPPPAVASAPHLRLSDHPVTASARTDTARTRTFIGGNYTRRRPPCYAPSMRLPLAAGAAVA